MCPGIELLKPTVQRFLAIEDGILLLCSDGLSDRNLVESSWQNYAEQILRSETPLEQAVQSWLDLAHSQNGDDNISLVLMSCQISRPMLKSKSNSNSNLVPIDPLSPRFQVAAGFRNSLLAKFGLNRMINLAIFCTAGIGLVAAATILVGVFNPEWLDGWRKQLFPDRFPQADLQISPIDRSTTNAVIEKR
jgi:protein phosphatase